jgi:hypothetical protein
MKRFCILTLALLLMLGCSKSGVLERRIGERVDACKADAPCIVRVKDLTDFPWDKMYVFSYGAYPEYIEKALGTPLPDYVEFQRRLVFLKNGKIVYREDEPTDIENLVNGEVTFAGMDTEPSYVSFTPDTAVFIAAKHKHSNGVAYSLTQVK